MSLDPSARCREVLAMSNKKAFMFQFKEFGRPLDMVEKLCDENDKMRDLLRWRCVKTEPPGVKGKYYTVSWNGLPKYDWFDPEQGWDGKDWRWTHWRPIGELPTRSLENDA